MSVVNTSQRQKNSNCKYWLREHLIGTLCP